MAASPREQGDYLGPCMDMLVDSYNTTYKNRLIERILSAQCIPTRPAYMVAEVVVVPSFQPEWMVRVLQYKDGDSELFLVLLDYNVWYSNQALAVVNGNEYQTFTDEPSPVASTCYRIPIDSTISNMLRHLFYAVLSPVKYNQCDVYDGVEYTFAMGYPGSALLCGQICSPEDESNTGKLVTLAETLCGIAQETNASYREIMVKQVKHIIDTFPIDLNNDIPKAF